MKMHILFANTEAQVQELQILPTLVPPDRLTPIRIRFYQLRLAKSAIFSPRLPYFQEAVDDYIKSIEEDLYRYQSSTSYWSNNLHKQDYTNICGSSYKPVLKEPDCDSGYSDG